MSLKNVANKIATDPPMPVFAKVRQALNEAYENDEQTQRFARTICDLTAYALLACAVGVRRVEALKGHSGRLDMNVFPIVVDGGGEGGDKAYVFKRTVRADAARFAGIMQEWLGSASAGAAQFKFTSNAGWHTFMVHKLDGAPHTRLCMYQSYQGTYRLSDFLGTNGDAFNGQAPLAQRQALFETKMLLGQHKVLTKAEFERNIVTPFQTGLTSGSTIDAERYGKMFGYATNNNQPINTLGLLLFEGTQGAEHMEMTRSRLTEGHQQTMQLVTPWVDIGGGDD
jgi:hypothetical protein